MNKQYNIYFSNYPGKGYYDLEVQDMRGYDHLEKFTNLTKEELAKTIEKMKAKYSDCSLCEFVY